MKRRKAAAFVATVAILGAATWVQAQLRFLEPREAPLQTVVSGPFLFITDVPAAEVQTLGLDLLAAERRITRELKLPRLAVPVRIHLFQTRARYNRYVQQNFPTLQRSASMRRAIFLLRNGAPHIFAHGSLDLGSDLRHELTHALLNTTVRGLPLWLDEGLAVFYEVHDGSGLQSGHAAMLRNRQRQGGVPGLAQMAALTEHTEMGKLEYAAAWSWAYFLLRGPVEVNNLLTDYLAEIRNGVHGASVQQRLAERLPDPNRSWRNTLETAAIRSRGGQ